MKRLGLVLALLAAALPAWAAVEPFYLDMLRDGMHAYDRKEYAKAAHDLRLACFGMLDEPKTLADCLARLALAQDRAEDVEGFRDTFRRIVEIEERFSAYTQGNATPELRTALEQRLPARIPAATLAGVPAFRALAQKVEAPASGKKPAGERPPRAEPRAADPAPSPPVQAAPVPAAPAAPQPITAAERDKMAQARKLLDDPKGATRTLKQAYQLAREVAGAHPDAKEAQHLAGEAAYRLSNWSEAATWFRRGGDPGEDEPELLFYLAVSLYKLGDQTGAASTMKRAVPKLQKTPFVEEYERRILGSSGRSGPASRVE
jgi:tetratricopeptide (TPR) repeat protein